MASGYNGRVGNWARVQGQWNISTLLSKTWGSQAGSDSGTFVGKGNRSSFPCKCVAGLEAIALCDGMFMVRSLEKRSMVIWESIVPLLFKQTTSISRPGDICLSGKREKLLPRSREVAVSSWILSDRKRKAIKSDVMRTLYGVVHNIFEIICRILFRVSRASLFYYVPFERQPGMGWMSPSVWGCDLRVVQNRCRTLRTVYTVWKVG